MKFGVIVFPGSNCDDDMVHVLGDVMGREVTKIWHKETALPAGFDPQTDCIVLPGGFPWARRAIWWFGGPKGLGKRIARSSPVANFQSE